MQEGEWGESEISQLQELLSKYNSVFTKPLRLSPSRTTNHTIPLEPGVAPVSVCPYRYSHWQKNEIEKLVTEMLAAGIIRPSTSAFSGLVLLVKEEDEN